MFKKWLGDGYDQDALIAVLAAAAVERLDGDPLWLLVISGSGNAKTETVQALTGADAVLTSSIASEGALLSGTSNKERAKDATGGLLPLGLYRACRCRETVPVTWHRALTGAGGGRLSTA